MLDANNIGKNILRLRKERKLSQLALGEELELSHDMVWKWETQRCYPGAGLLVEIANYFGVSIDSLFEEIKESEEEDDG